MTNFPYNSGHEVGGGPNSLAAVKESAVVIVLTVEER